jgi:hypothetical protein
MKNVRPYVQWPSCRSHLTNSHDGYAGTVEVLRLGDVNRHEIHTEFYDRWPVHLWKIFCLYIKRRTVRPVRQTDTNKVLMQLSVCFMFYRLGLIVSLSEFVIQ